MCICIGMHKYINTTFWICFCCYVYVVSSWPLCFIITNKRSSFISSRHNELRGTSQKEAGAGSFVLCWDWMHEAKRLEGTEGHRGRGRKSNGCRISASTSRTGMDVHKWEKQKKDPLQSHWPNFSRMLEFNPWGNKSNDKPTQPRGGKVLYLNKVFNLVEVLYIFMEERIPRWFLVFLFMFSCSTWL